MFLNVPHLLGLQTKRQALVDRNALAAKMLIALKPLDEILWSRFGRPAIG